MTILFVLFGAGLATEALLYVFWGQHRARNVLAVVTLLLATFPTGGLLLWRPGVWSVLFALASFCRAFNMIRVVEARMHKEYLRFATHRTSLTLAGFLAIDVALWLVWQAWHPAGHTTWAIVAGVQLTGAAMLLLSTVRRLHRTAWSAQEQAYSDADLPTVTVAIPARNETEDLQACLQNIIASDYPKLEVLVLDDCSQTRRTPEIIRNFAHDGVRFIRGELPRDTWLPKNQAYDRLSQEASGDYILFCGVDIRLEPAAIRQLITMMLHTRKQMVSVLPQRARSMRDPVAIVQAMRYWWELTPPRRLFNRPPVLSSCWVIKTAALRKAGGFAAVSRSIVPEAYFAKRLLAEDGYSFRRAGGMLGLQSNKPAAEQRATAVRTRYPQVHRKPEQAMLVALGELFFLTTPFVLAIGGFWLSVGGAAQLLAALAAAALICTYELVTHSTRTSSWWFALVALPVGVLVDITLLLYSMWQYEFSTVDWKGRNVCVPVMHVVPHLPKL
jgi:Glycosyl transferase family 2